MMKLLGGGYNRRKMLTLTLIKIYTKRWNKDGWLTVHKKSHKKSI